MAPESEPLVSNHENTLDFPVARAKIISDESWVSSQLEYDSQCSALINRSHEGGVFMEQKRNQTDRRRVFQMAGMTAVAGVWAIAVQGSAHGRETMMTGSGRRMIRCLLA